MSGEKAGHRDQFLDKVRQRWHCDDGKRDMKATTVSEAVAIAKNVCFGWSVPRATKEKVRKRGWVLRGGSRVCAVCFALLDGQARSTTGGPAIWNVAGKTEVLWIWCDTNVEPQHVLGRLQVPEKWCGEGAGVNMTSTRRATGQGGKVEKVLRDFLVSRDRA